MYWLPQSHCGDKRGAHCFHDCIYIYIYISIYIIYISIYIYIYRELICFFLKQSVNIGVGNTLDIFCHYEFCGLNNILTFESLIFKSIK